MILYCIITYLIFFGILLNEHDYLEQWDINDILCLILAPLTVPVIAGMSINRKNNEK